MISDITDNLQAALEVMTSYPDDSIPTVELERLYLRIGKRYPFVEIEGPYSEVEIDGQTYQATDTSSEYVIRYYVKYNDEVQTDAAITYVTRNVHGDIIKALKLDTTRGGNAVVTKVAGHGNAFEEIDNQLEFYIYVVLDVQSRIDAKDPSLLG